MSKDFIIDEWRSAGEDGGPELEMLADVLHAVVHDGASVSFILPFSKDDARRFWTDKVFPGLASGSRRLFVARSGGRIVGTVQLEMAGQPNQQHRAEVVKLLVHPDARRRGIARALMAALEEVARAERRTLLTLDTRTGDRAEPLYLSMGYVPVGKIPRFARGPHSPELEATSIFYKELA
jgi:GNAT superfamily N-acetyltransferase